MHARPALRCALILSILTLAPLQPTWGDGPQQGGPPAPSKTQKPATADKPAPTKATATVALPALPAATNDNPASTTPTATPTPVVIAPGSMTEASRTRAGTEARLKELDAPDKKDNPATRATVEVLQRRMKLLDAWKAAADKRALAEHPNPSPDQMEAELKADLDRTRTMAEQATKSPDDLLPQAFAAPVATAPAKSPEAHLAEMKEAIDAARQELNERSGDLTKLREVQAARVDPATLKAERDQVHQTLAALAAGRNERELAITNAGTPEARDLARDRLVNYEWEYRVETEHLATLEARITLNGRQADLGALQIQAKANRIEVSRRIVEWMEKRYASQSERQQKDLQSAVAKEESKAEHTDDVLERYRAQRSAELLRLEGKAVAYEKALATTQGNLSVDKQKKLADETVDYFEKNLKQPLNDGNVSPLDVIRLKNSFRRIGPIRTSIVKGDLDTIRSELTTFENALADVELDLVNDARDDRYDREALLDKLPEARHHEAESLLDVMEARHLTLMNRLQAVLQKLAQRAENTQSEIERRIRTLDEEYTFIRTHIFWVRDAEPIGTATLLHARSDAVRTARAVVKLGAEVGDRSLWGRVAPDFILAIVGLVVLPWPLRLGQKALDRLRLAAPDPSMTAENAPSAVVG